MNNHFDRLLASFESRRFSYIGTLTDPGVDDPQATNQPGWFARTYQYSATIPHAVTNVNPETGSPDTYSYDANGNMTCRIENGVTYSQTYNAENRISSIAKRTGDCATGTILESWSFAYDGDGVRVSTAHFTGASGTPDSTTSYFMGGGYELKDGATKKYYSIAGMMVAVNDPSAGSGQVGLQYLLTDHLGSTVAVTNSSGTLTSQQRYLPFGAARTIPNSPILGTDFTYTGQRKLDNGMGGIMDYRARMYSPQLGRFIQPDTIIPNHGNPQNFNRFTYVLNNPIRFTDPSGHQVCWEGSTPGNCLDAMGSIKKEIKDTYGVTLSNGGAEHPYFASSRSRTWDLKNSLLVLQGLSQMDDILNGNLKTIIGSATFTLNSHPDPAFFGYTTHPNGSNIVDFYNNSTIPLLNLYHEFGHVLDNSTGDAFTGPLGETVHRSDTGEYWFGGNGIGLLSSQTLLSSSRLSDPNPDNWPFDIYALQNNIGTANEQWADLWANYVAGNINQSTDAGRDAYDWITGQLAPYAVGMP